MYENVNLYRTILVISGGKTGSSTLEESCLELKRRYNDPSLVVARTHNESEVRHHIFAASSTSRVLILTSFRDPLTRMVSSLFQNLALHVPELETTVGVFDQLIVLKNFMDRCFDPNDSNFFEAYHPMGAPPEPVRTAVLTTTDNVDTLWLRFDRIHEWSEMIGIVLPGFRLVPQNLSSQKHYSRLYTIFRHLYKYPYPQVRRLVEQERAIWQQYMTDEEMEDKISQWSIVV